VIETFDIALLAHRVARLVARADLLAHLRRQIIEAVQVRVGADTYVLDADELHDVVDVIDQVLDRRGLPVTHEHAYAGDAHDAALGRYLFDRLVGLEARMLQQRATVRMRDGDRLAGQLDTVQRRPVPAM
jgi:hypothetical protein